ncbi:SAVED domain-containing protein [Vibrio vulnificus]|uniref:SAVED domain-containing protein n=1 Tax=Vibrio vulnificus TaxID=672 RepID=UPI001A2095E5|nr:SAVED domain-containing protein [Vibrio vulnificus]ELV8750302.1 SAVED domain-containing protein [Vibrio vulnificus]ELV8791826.1 SAVED domain-containing protein [Vibrio vulnificus]MCA4016823.1 SAVED domain-containing protein [Vibrio vulnificus]HAS6197547.1 SAVED domain-containing protein [Vibrio vulnificus]
MKGALAQLLDFGYVIFQRRLSSARYLIKTGLLLLTIGAAPSLIFKVTKGEYSLLIDSASSPQPIVWLTSIAYLGLASIILGLIFEVKERVCGEAVAMKRAKSIDIRSLDGAAAPTLADTFHVTVESTGAHQDLFLWKERGETDEEWLEHSCKTLLDFADNSLRRLNSFEPQKPLALGALAHIPHCFALGFFVGNKRLVNYYCWQRDTKGKDASRWVDCRDARSRGQSLIQPIFVPKLDNLTSVRRLGLTIEVSLSNDETQFLKDLDLDQVVKFQVKNKRIGNMFSDIEQSNLVAEIRQNVNNILSTYTNLEELHITITAQCSLVMRLGAEFNQNHIKLPIYIYHFQSNKYQWAFILNLISEHNLTYILNPGASREA